MKFNYLIIAAFIFLSSCNDQTNTETTIVSSEATTDSNSAAINTAKTIAAATTIQFSKTKHDFGTINEGVEVEHDFVFKNTGTQPLIISDAKASCGCTIPEWTKDPVMPGQEGKLKVKYNSEGRQGVIHKTVNVTANTEPAVTILDIDVVVNPRDNNIGPVNK